MNKKFTVLIFAIIFGLLGTTIAYLANFEKLGKIYTELLVKYIYTGDTYFPNHISSPYYDVHILDDYVQNSAQIIGSDFEKLYGNYNKKYQIQYVKEGSKKFAFSRTSDNSKENLEILNKVVNEMTSYSELKFRNDIKRNIKTLNEYLIHKNCEQILNENVINESTEKRLKDIQKLIDEYRNIIENRRTIGQKDFVASTLLMQEAYNSMVSRVGTFKEKHKNCEFHKRKLEMEKFLYNQLEELLSYNITIKEKKIINDSKFLFLKGFINGILFFIFLRLSILYFRK
tara:strand:+ start:133 stop:990 length:858 start_codon:yes stop_codon:yes gene_type:complete